MIAYRRIIQEVSLKNRPLSVCQFWKRRRESHGDGIVIFERRILSRRTMLWWRWLRSPFFFNLAPTFSTVFHVLWMKNGNIAGWKVTNTTGRLYFFCYVWNFGGFVDTYVALTLSLLVFLVNYHTATSPIYCCRCFGGFCS